MLTSPPFASNVTFNLSVVLFALIKFTSTTFTVAFPALSIAKIVYLPFDVTSNEPVKLFPVASSEPEISVPPVTKFATVFSPDNHLTCTIPDKLSVTAV